MEQSFAMFDNLTKHLVDFIDMILICGIVLLATLHDIIPGEVQVRQASVLL